VKNRGESAPLFQAGARGRPELSPHQTAAVREIALLLERRGGAILADAIGLGKTWVAIELARGELARGGRVDIIVPASLMSSWRIELDRFGVELPIASHDSLRRRVVTLEPGSEGGLLIVDEAHHFRNPQTRGYSALARFSIGKRVLLVTATPVSNSLRDLAALLALIAPDDSLRDAGLVSFEQVFGTSDFERISLIRRELVVRRDRSVLPRALWFGRVESRAIPYEVCGATGVICAVDELRFPLIARLSSRRVLQLFLKHRLGSSVEALRDSLTRQLRFCRRARNALDHGFSISKRDFHQLFHDDEEGPIQEMLFPEVWLDRSSDPNGAIDELVDESRRLTSLLEQVRHLRSTKFGVLLGDLHQSLEPSLVFTTAVRTALEIHGFLGRELKSAIVTSRTAAIGSIRCSREAALGSFMRGDTDALVLTDLGSEGLNLQRAAKVVHFDLPWNPARIDQRLGRAHRIGQTRSKVDCVFLVWDGDPDRRLEEILQRKTRIRRRFDSEQFVGAGILHERADRVDPGRILLPSRIAGSTPQGRLISRLTASGIADDDLCSALVRRYRAGAELLIDAIARSLEPGRDELDRLKEILSRERETYGSPVGKGRAGSS